MRPKAAARSDRGALHAPEAPAAAHSRAAGAPRAATPHNRRTPPEAFVPLWPRCGHCGGPARPSGEPALRVEFAVETVSEANRRDRWGKVERKKAQREATLEAVSVALASGGVIPERGPWFVRFTRVSSTHLDRGNLPSALKAVEDAVAACLRVDDGSPLYEPAYEQERRGRRPEGVRVEVWGS